MDNAGNFELLCPTVRPELAAGLATSVSPISVTLVDGHQARSFAALCNSAIRRSEKDFVVVANDKSRPTRQDVEKTLALLQSGFGLVGLYRLGFFGFHKEVFNYLGGFDEDFSDGGFEDNDIYLRLKFNDIGVYLSEEIDYVRGRPSSWAQVESRRHFFQKYNFGVFSKVIFADFQSLRPLANRERPGGLKGWEESVFDVIPLETMKSRFEVFLADGLFVDRSQRGNYLVLLRRVLRAARCLLIGSVPPILEWKRYRGDRPR